MTNNLRYATALVALLSVGGCAQTQTHEKVMLNRGCHVGEPDSQCETRLQEQSQRRWHVANCEENESDQQCEARLEREKQAQIAAYRAREADPAYQAQRAQDQAQRAQEVAVLREQQADELECRLQAQMAASNASMSGGIVGGAIYGAATGNHIYATCMQMMAARH